MDVMLLRVRLNPWRLEALLCLDGMLSGSGLYQRPLFTVLHGNTFSPILILPVVNEPIEGLMLIYMVHFFTAIVGAEWWAQLLEKYLSFLSLVAFNNDDSCKIDDKGTSLVLVLLTQLRRLK